MNCCDDTLVRPPFRLIPDCNPRSERGETRFFPASTIQYQLDSHSKSLIRKEHSTSFTDFWFVISLSFYRRNDALSFRPQYPPSLLLEIPRSINQTIRDIAYKHIFMSFSFSLYHQPHPHIHSFIVPYSIANLKIVNISDPTTKPLPAR